MRPALSVIFLTTLSGTGQGLFLALFAAELARADAGPPFYWVGALIALVLTGLGLVASFFHLGHPERAWRAVAMWRTSWLSREVIALPLFMAALAAWGGLHYLERASTAWAGALTTLLCLTLFVCTGMIYAAIKFLQEWAHPLTLVNFLLLGCANGCVLAAALSAQSAPSLTRALTLAALLLTGAGAALRWASLRRNAGLKARSTLQSAIGIRHPRIVQKAQGFMGGSFNTREFFHGRTPQVLHAVKWGFLVGAFGLPALLLALALVGPAAAWLTLAFGVQYLGLLAERWYFFAQANHPQNLYYQSMS